MKQIKIDPDYTKKVLAELISIPSPSGYTDQVVHYVCDKLSELGIPFELTRRGAIRATLKGKSSSPAKSIVAHLDTLGAMVKSLKSNGRLSIAPIGHWSSRFAEGGRVLIFTEKEPKRGTVLPLKASGHTYNEEIDTQETSWEHIEVRVDENTESVEDLKKHSFEVGDFIAFDPNFEITPNGFINSRHLDNKAGVASLLSTAKSVVDSGVDLPTNAHLLFTIMEEVGSGASAVLHGDVAEMLSIDNSTVAPGQNSSPNGITVAIKDSTGPFDYHLTKHVLDLCKENHLNYSRDVFRYYRCDAASAIEAGNDIRTALVCFACDASHGYERTHIDSLQELSKLLSLYLQSEAVSERDKNPLNELSGFSTQPIVKDPLINPEKPVRSDQYEDDEG
tara:strand:- start:16089 stop:17264 length:1176 start_codon:yes stop_codon:yes gene_type:complete